MSRSAVSAEQGGPRSSGKSRRLITSVCSSLAAMASSRDTTDSMRLDQVPACALIAIGLLQGVCAIAEACTNEGLVYSCRRSICAPSHAVLGWTMYAVGPCSVI